MTTKILSTYVAAGYALSPTFSELDITSTGGVGGSGVYSNHAATISNAGSIKASSGYGVDLPSGGYVLNKPSGFIAGPTGVGGGNIIPTTVVNLGYLKGGLGRAVLVGGGAVRNGAYAYHKARMVGSVEVATYGTVSNYGTISGDVVVEGGGTVTNGAAPGFGSAGDLSARIEGVTGVALDQAGTVANFGVIVGTGLAGSGTYGGVFLLQGGRLVNGVAIYDQSALIEGYGGVAAFAAAGTVTNYGTIEGLAGGPGVTLHAGGSVTNGAASDTIALIEGGAGVAGYSYPHGAGSVGGTGGAGGAGVVLAAGGVLGNSAGIEGGQGGVGGYAYLQGGAGGGGGAGVALAGSASATNRGVIAGGLGGHGEDNYGRYVNSVGGNGAAGGAGATLSAGAALTNDATIVGGAGGAGGYGAARYGTTGASGDGVVLSGGGRVTNGGRKDATALIEGAIGVQTGGAGAATVTNFGVIQGAGGTALSFSSSADLLVVEAGCAFMGAVRGGGGRLDLASGVGTLSGLAGGTVTVSGSMATTTFQNFATVQVGAGASFTDTGAVTIAVGQVVNDAGTLTLGGAGAASIVNAGLIETTGSGTLTLSGAVTNTGALAADGGALTVSGAVTGAGHASIKGGTLNLASNFTENVTFNGATGILKLARSQGYTGTVTGFSKSGGTSLDLVDIGFVSASEATFSGTATSGVLTVTDGTHTAHIKLKGDYLASSFVAASDGHGGVVVHDPAQATLGASPPSTSAGLAHQLIAAMAGLGAGGIALEAGAGRLARAAPTLLAPRANMA